MTAPSITIVQLDPHVPLDRFGGWLRGAVLRNIPAWRKPLPPVDELGSGVVVLGGRLSVTDREPWMDPVKRMMVAAVDDNLPVLGICLGHHLLAEAFGGEFRVNDPGGGEHGPVDVQWQPAARTDPILGRVASAPGTLFPGFHDDVVTRLPHGSKDLARSAAYTHQAFRIGSAVGVQFHPEASPDLMATWAEMQGADSMKMRRSMRIVDDTLTRNGTLVAQGFAQATREYAESAADRDYRAA